MVIFSGLFKVCYWAGLIGGTLLVLAIIGAVNQHDKLLSMAAVGSGLADVFVWGIELIKALFTGLAKVAKSL
jgi:hypothetical protein